MPPKHAKLPRLAVVLAALMMMASILTACKSSVPRNMETTAPPASGTDTPTVTSAPPEPSVTPLPSAPDITPAPNTPVVPEPSVSSVFPLPDCLNNIGKTYNELMQENPDFVYQKIGIPDAQGQFLGLPDGNFSCYFYGAQDNPYLDEISDQYGDRLTCTGILSTVGEIFPDMSEKMSLEQFFATYGILEYEYILEIRPDRGWIFFSYNDLFTGINTNPGGVAFSLDFTESNVIERGYTVLMEDRSVGYRGDSNDEVLHEVWGF